MVLWRRQGYPEAYVRGATVSGHVRECAVIQNIVRRNPENEGFYSTSAVAAPIISAPTCQDRAARFSACGPGDSGLIAGGMSYIISPLCAAKEVVDQVLRTTRK